MKSQIVQFFNQHQYFGSLIVWALIFIIICISFSKQRRLILLSGLLAAPQAVLGLALAPQYWKPDYILDFGIGIEDFIFLFLFGGMGWIGAVWPSRNKFAFQIQKFPLLKRILLYCAFGIVAWGLYSLLKIRKIEVAFLVMLSWVVFLIVVKKTPWLIALSGFVFLLFVYFIGGQLILLLWPDILSLWTLQNLWGVKLFGIVLEELIWVGLYGGAWALTLAYFFNVKRINTD